MKPQVIILGAGKPHFGTEASAMIEILNKKKTLDFVLDIIETNVSNIQFISGLNFNEVKKKYKNISIRCNKNWEKTGPIYSLSKSKISEDKDLIIIYSDILFRESLFGKILNSKSDLTIACDINYKDRFKNRDLEDQKRVEKILLDKKNRNKCIYNKNVNSKHAELLGIIKIKKNKIFELKKYLHIANKKKNNLKLSDLLSHFQKLKFNTKIIDSKGDWSELYNLNDISNFILGSKSETLHRLRGVIKKGKILDQVKFNVREWKKNKEYIIKQIFQKFDKKLLIVRSSAIDEDGSNCSNAGKYSSILNVKGARKLILAVNKVIKSYDFTNKKNEIFVQPHLKNSKFVGVVTTQSKSSGSPWYVINYVKTDNTEIVTKGDSNKTKTIFLRRDIKIHEIEKIFLKKLYLSIRELEILLCNENLDIEFAIDKKYEIFIFQVRPLVVRVDNKRSEDDILKNYEVNQNKYLNFKSASKLKVKNPKIFGVMPDWNPAEIIGFKPDNLSLSLYQKLITKKNWAKQRYEFGYRKIYNSKLIESFCGTPYVSVNKSIESFLPRNLPNIISNKILKISLKKLYENPSKHDKLEFEILPNCLDYDFFKWKNFYLKKNLTKFEINLLKKNLKEINKNAQNIYEHYSKKLNYFEKFQISKSKNNITKIYSLINLCVNNLTLMFAHFARCGFVSVIIMNSALRNKKITKRKYDNFFNSIKTISQEYQDDIGLYKNKKLSKLTLIKKYGHLRPGTYDITSQRYDENLDLLFKVPKTRKKNKKKPISRDLVFNEKFIQELREIGFDGNKKNIINFFYGSIEKRESSKFLFTKYLSDILKLISLELNQKKLNNYEISMLNLDDIIAYFSSKINITTLKQKIKKNEVEHKINLACDMPNLISSVTQFKKFELLLDEPNFVGDKSVNSEIVHISKFENKKRLTNKIAIINSADPGYDWIFSHKISGLVTKYGGVNSHMAIRCAELNLPAAIGVGEKTFENLKYSNKIFIDPKNKILKVI